MASSKQLGAQDLANLFHRTRLTHELSEFHMRNRRGLRFGQLQFLFDWHSFGFYGLD
jgi:hypothetical protein